MVVPSWRKVLVLMMCWGWVSTAEGSFLGWRIRGPKTPKSRRQRASTTARAIHELPTQQRNSQRRRATTMLSEADTSTPQSNQSDASEVQMDIEQIVASVRKSKQEGNLEHFGQALSDLFKAFCVVDQDKLVASYEPGDRYGRLQAMRLQKLFRIGDFMMHLIASLIDANSFPPFAQCQAFLDKVDQVLTEVPPGRRVKNRTTFAKYVGKRARLAQRPNRLKPYPQARYEQIAFAIANANPLSGLIAKSEVDVISNEGGSHADNGGSHPSSSGHHQYPGGVCNRAGYGSQY